MRGSRRAKTWSWYDALLTAANVLLWAYLAHLLLLNYSSQNDLRRSLAARITNDTERQAATIGYFLSERRRDIERLATSPDVLAYFENKALGMSMAYGLRATLVQAQARIDAMQREEVAAGQTAFRHIHLAEADGTLLAESESCASANHQALDGSMTAGNHDRMLPGGELVMQAPVVFKGQAAGVVLAWIDLKPVMQRLVKGENGLFRHWVGLCQNGRVLFSPDADGQTSPPLLPVSQGGKVGFAESEGRLGCLAPIAGSGLELAVNLPAADVFGAINPRQQLIGIGAVAAALLFGLIGFLRHAERKRMTHAVRESEERLSLALNATNDGVWDWDCFTGDMYFSPRWLQMLELSPENVPANMTEREASIHPDDLPAMRDAMDKHLQGKADTYESEYRCRTGSGAWKWILARGRVIGRDGQGRPLRMIGTHTDISARKEAERLLEEANRELERRVQERTAMLLQSEKMASIGQLAAGVAHEINNPAGFVCSNLTTMKEYAGGLTELADLWGKSVSDGENGRFRAEEALRTAKETLDRIDYAFIRDDLGSLLSESREGMDRIARIVSDLKDFSHVDKEDMVSECDINLLIDKAVNVAWNELKYKCEIAKEYGSLPPVRVNGGQISQVILNLLVNAAQAMEAYGMLRIRTSFGDDRIQIEIQDNGAGIPQELQGKIFDPFFTTKPVGQGTGLGLHICQKIVTAHGGSISVKSLPGDGATFTVSLPVALGLQAQQLPGE